jgi:hypothetical protein
VAYVSETADRLSKAEARALATAFRNMSDGAEDLLAMLRRAKAENGGALAGEDLWHQIAREMSALETAPPTFRQRLKIAAGALVVFAVAALYFVKLRLP